MCMMMHASAVLYIYDVRTCFTTKKIKNIYVSFAPSLLEVSVNRTTLSSEKEFAIMVYMSTNKATRDVTQY